MTAGFVTSDGRTLAYRRFGSGPLLVCHPGGPGFPGATLGELGGLAGEHELVILDPRGAGASDRPPVTDGYRFEDYVADLDELQRHLEVEALDLLGHSHGGFVAMAYAAARPTQVRRLVLVSTAPRFAQEYTDAINAVWDASADPRVEEARRAREQRLSGAVRDRNEFIRLAMLENRLFFAHPEHAEELGAVFREQPPNLDALSYFNEAIAPHYDLRPELDRIRAPTLVVTGDHDFFGALAAGEIVAGIPDARRVVLDDAGHFAWADAPEQFREEVSRFLAG
jgi:pimeloyl-ACP methyl ester carboxylesterase